jgi:hypothetical protein
MAMCCRSYITKRLGANLGKEKHVFRANLLTRVEELDG